MTTAPDSRAERRERLMQAGALEQAPTTALEEDITTGPGFVARARKSVVAFVGALAASLGPAAVTLTADGALTLDEAVPAIVTGLGLAFAAAVAVYAIPNAKTQS